MFRVYFNPYQISVLQQFWNFKLICTVTISTESALLISNFLFLNIWITLQANNTYYRISSSYVRSNFNTVLYPLLNTNLNFRIFLIFEFPNKRLFRSFLFVLLYTLCPFNTVNLYYYTHIIIMVQLLLVQFHILSQIIIGLIHFSWSYYSCSNYVVQSILLVHISYFDLAIILHISLSTFLHFTWPFLLY